MNEERKIAVIDLETTGLNGWNSEVVEVAMVIVQGGVIQDGFHSLVWPGESYFANGRAREALELQGRTVDHFKGAPTTIEVSRALFAKIAGVSRATAFNVQFEKKFLTKRWWLGKEKLSWPFCIMEKASKIMGKAGSRYCPWNDHHESYKWPKLHQAAEFFKVPWKQGELHGALHDAQVAAYIMLEMRKRGDM